jgi:hypothetical protein
MQIKWVVLLTHTERKTSVVAGMFTDWDVANAWARDHSGPMVSGTVVDYREASDWPSDKIAKSNMTKAEQIAMARKSYGDY